jgi:eukaryotic-like serine/threonine-protein kinase
LKGETPPERWARLNELFESALGRGTAERPAFLEDACRSDPSMRQEVESLLAAHEEAGGFLEGPPGAAGTEPGSEERLHAGTRLGPYEIVALLATGGMGEVYRARDHRLGREVAVKTLPRASLGDASRRRRFDQEARAAGALNHPNILAVYDVGTEADGPYVVCELLEGDTLRARLRGPRPLPVAEAFALARQVASGLAAAHEKGIVHRDLKPANVFVTADGRAKILDFGLAKWLPAAGPSEATEATRPGTLLGTLGYMSPEQLRGEPADRRSDVFSFGALLYEMLSGRRAFGGGSAAESMSAILREEPAPLPGVPLALEVLVRRCLRKRPEDRFPSGRDLLAALEAASEGALSAAPEPPSIAVLPFANLSADPDQEYFCEGLAEELIAALSRLAGLRVAARSSSFRFQGRGTDLRRVGAELHVDRVLEGSVRKAGGRLRVAVQLVDVRQGYQLWSERYDRGLEDVFAVQDEIAAQVARTIAPALAPRESAAAGRSRTRDLEAYHLYLRGRHSWNKRHQGGLQSAVRYFDQAVDRDPAYAAAYAGLADTYALLGLEIYGVLPPREAMPRAKAAAERALELDPALAEPRAARAWVRLHYDWDWAGAEEDFRASLELDPGLATTHHWYSFLLSARGRHHEATAAARRAWERDPLSSIVNSNRLRAAYYARRFDEVLEAGQRLVEMEPEFGVHHFWVGLAQTALGRYEEAAVSHRRQAQLSGNQVLGHLGHAWARAGRLADAEKMLEELRGRAGNHSVAAGHAALVCVGLGRIEEALSWLETACEARSDQMAFLDVEPLYDPLRDQPRFEALRRRVGLVPPQEATPRGSSPPMEVLAAPVVRRAVAVLPFRDLAGASGSGHLGLGLADATITELAGVDALLVRPTSAILRFEGQAPAPADVARELQVDAVVDGSFQQAGERLRVTVQLVGGDGRTLWASKMDTSLADIFAMQDDVSRNIARALEVRLTAADERRLGLRSPAPGGQAYEQYLKGKTHFLRETLEEFIAAVDCFEKARELDPGFAEAWAGLAEAYARISFNFQPQGDWYARARSACEKALSLRPGLPEGRYVRAYLRWCQRGGWDSAAALRDLGAAIAARPNLHEAHLRRGVVLYHVGLVEEAWAPLQQAVAICPDDTIARYQLGFCRYHQGRYEDALAITEEVARTSPTFWLHYQAALCLLRLGRHEDAGEKLRLLAEETPGRHLGFAVRGLISALRGDAAAAHEQVRLTMENGTAFGHYHHAQYEVACIHALLGEQDEAVHTLTEAAANGYPCLPLFRDDPLLAGLHGSEAYRRLLSRLEREQAVYAQAHQERAV